MDRKLVKQAMAVAYKTGDYANIRYWQLDRLTDQELRDYIKNGNLKLQGALACQI